MLTAHAAHNASATSNTYTHHVDGRGRTFSWPWRAPRKPVPLGEGAAMDALQEVYRNKGCSQPQRLIRYDWVGCDMRVVWVWLGYCVCMY